jgi:hypothetical protein
MVVSCTVIAFFLLIGFVFWLASLHDKKDWGADESSAAPHGGAPHAGGHPVVTR